MNLSKKRCAAGFTLVELAIVAGIAGLFIGAVWTASSLVLSANRQRAAGQELAAIAQAVRTVFAEQSGVMGRRANLTLALDRMAAMPQEMRQTVNTAAGILFHPWNQQVVTGLGSAIVYASNCAGAEAGSDTSVEPCFTVSFLRVPRDACIKLAALSPAAGLQGLIINSSSLLTPPVAASVAASNCGTSSNQLNWVYLLRDN